MKRVGRNLNEVNRRISASKRFWGKHFWFIIHYLALKLTTEEFFKLLVLLTKLLPCFECRVHLEENIEGLRRLKNKDSFEISYELHSLVNYQVGVSKNPDFAKVKAFYVNYGSGLIDQEIIFVLRAICFKYDGYLAELASLTNIFKEYGGRLLLRTLKALPLTAEYETQDDLFFWSFRVGTFYDGLIGTKPPTNEEVKKFFSEGLQESCDECSLK